MLAMKKLSAVLFLTFMVAAFAAPLLVSAPAHAEGVAVQMPAGDNEFSMKKFIGLAMGLAIGLAAFGGSLGQARAAGAALEGIARNPGAANKIFVPMILALAFIESLVLYALVIAFTLNGKL